jgi:hypothetical protein
VTIDLPETFSAGDVDDDGQIGLYEWRQWKRGALSEFAQLDRNGDGFLTPAELVRGAAGTVNAPAITPLVATSGPTASPSSPAPVSATPPSSPTHPADATVANAEASDPANEVATRRAESLFRIMDSNQDGTLDSKEWMSSNRLRPQFEAAGIDLKQPMPRDVFVQHYLKLNSSNT